MGPLRGVSDRLHTPHHPADACLDALVAVAKQEDQAAVATKSANRTRHRTVEEDEVRARHLQHDAEVRSKVMKEGSEGGLLLRHGVATGELYSAAILRLRAGEARHTWRAAASASTIVAMLANASV